MNTFSFDTSLQRICNSIMNVACSDEEEGEVKVQRRACRGLADVWTFDISASVKKEGTRIGEPHRVSGTKIVTKPATQPPLLAMAQSLFVQSSFPR
jgi:hypothetical protein